MPVEADATDLHVYKMPKKGVNLYVEKTEISSEEAVKTTNMFWRDGLQKRKGYSKFETDEIATSKKVTGVHRFYYSTASKQTLASAGTVVKYHDGATWQDAKTGLTDGAQVLFETWGALDKLYVANGVEAPFSWSGSAAASLTGLTGAVIQFLSYQDRLLYLSNTTPGGLGWSNSFVDDVWSAPSTTGVQPDSHLHGMVIHAAQVSDAGLASKVLLGGSDGMYLFSGNDLRTPSTTGDYKIESLGTRVGCESPLTMKWTPSGTIYLGTDKQLYILPFNSLTPVPIGHKITAEGNQDEDGLESIPAAQMPNASAVYHDGFYKLSIAVTGGTTNSRQWWLDVNRLDRDENRFWGPWYGPMKGMNFHGQTVLSGPGDNNEWYAGESNGATGGFVYEASQSGTFADSGSAMDIEFQTFYNPLSVETLNKVLHRLEIELLSTSGSYNIDYFDTVKKIKNGDVLSLTDDTILWGAQQWGAFNWQSTGPSREQFPIDPAIHCRYLSLLFKFTSSTEVKLYKIMVEELQQYDPLGGIE
jgi:hypothetical protein